jgi:predicted RND superfamily exporter protein
LIRLGVHLEGAPDSLKDPRVLQAIAQIDHDMEKEPLTTLSLSLADVIAEFNQAFQGGDRNARTIPQSASLITQYLTLVDRNDRATLASDDYARGRIAILLEDHGSAPTERLAARLQSSIDRSGLAALGVKTSLTGIAIVGYRELDRIVVELLYSFGCAFALIVLLQALFFRSLRIALISIVPNLLPMVACFCVTRLLHIDLRLDTCLVLCVSIGGLFNTTIHYSARVVQSVAGGARNPDEILLQAMRAVGPPSLYTAAILSIGFAVFAVSSFYGFRVFGLLSMITLVSGFFSDMIVTTVMMRMIFDWRRALARRPVPDLHPMIAE